MKKRSKKKFIIFKKKAFPFFGFLLSILLLSFILTRFPPEEIVKIIGINNSYIALFFLAFLGGISIFFPFPYYIVVFMFGAAGLNPFLLGICAGFGVILGDTTSYFIGYTGREIVPDKFNKYFSKFYLWVNKKPLWVMSIVLFLYGAFVPFPNDAVIIPLGIARYKYWRAIIPLAIGNIVFSTLIAFAGLYGWNLINLFL